MSGGPVAAILLVLGLPAPAEEPLTLEQVLAAARSANALLPVAREDVSTAMARERQAAGQLLPQLSLLSDAVFATGGATYSGGPSEDRLQVVVRQPVYQGGELRARRSQAQALTRAAKAGYRAGEKDVDAEVRVLFATYLEAESELGFRREGAARLRGYLTGVRSRQAAGQGVTTDLLKTRARIADEDANIADAQRQLDEARLQLNELMGRDPAAPLRLASLPEPLAPAAAPETGWTTVPEIARARAELDAARAGVAVARAGRLPHLDASGDAGLLGPGLTGGPPSSLGSRLRTDFGVSLTLSLTWSLLDFGIYRGRRDEAEALALQAERRVAALERSSRLEWERARAQLATLYRAIEARRQALPIALDAYLSAESLYRGGSGTALEVLDAYSALIGASSAHAQTVLSYRIAEARSIRWGTP
jgi:multidrug efflux system outer membrane protein